MAQALLVDEANSRPQATTTTQKTAQIQLLRLPAELRLICYAYAFSHPTSALGRPSEDLALLLTCKQIYNEASLLAFSLTHFQIALQRLSELPSRLRRLRYEQIQSIQSLTVKIDSQGWISYRPKNFDGFLPRFNPCGYSRLQLETLTLSVEHKGHYASPIFLDFLHWWRGKYFTLSYQMGELSAQTSPSRSLTDLMLQWLRALNANRVLLLNRDRVRDEAFDLLFLMTNPVERDGRLIIGGEGNEWEIEKPGQRLEMIRYTKVEPTVFERPKM